MWDLGEAKSRILDDDEVGVQVSHGYWIEQQGYWYTAVFGEEWACMPKTTLRAAVEAAWTHYNGTGRPDTPLARFCRTKASIDKVLSQLTIDDLL